jgi:hypothetical protein
MQSGQNVAALKTLTVIPRSFPGGPTGAFGIELFHYQECIQVDGPTAGGLDTD